MIKAIIFGLWACLITIGAQIGAHQARELLAARASAKTVAAAIDVRKTREINIPRIKNGVIRGYVVTILNYQVDLGALNGAALQPDAVVADEVFRYIYEDDTIDFDHLDRFDIGKMTKTLATSVNARIKVEAVRDIGVQEFTFIPSAEAKQRM